jgi:hypothetical protein
MKEDKHLLLGTAAAALLFGSTAVLGSAQASPLQYVGIARPPLVISRPRLHWERCGGSGFLDSRIS